MKNFKQSSAAALLGQVSVHVGPGAPLQRPAGTGHVGICKVLGRINTLVRKARIARV